MNQLLRPVVRHELRELAGSRLLWVGLALTGLLVYSAAIVTWPTLAGDDLVVARGVYLLSGVCLLLGAELASRDRRTRVQELVTTTPASPARLVGARLGALAAATAVAVSLVWLATLGWSLARGGRGLPDLRLLADAILAVILATWAGFAVGSWIKARLAGLLAAFVWVAGSSAMTDLEQVARLRLPVQWLSPRLGRATRSAIAGVLPDVTWARLGWLAGLAVVLAGVLLLAARGRRPGWAASRAAAVVAAGAVLAVVSAAGLLRAPDAVWFKGPGPQDWAAVDPVTQLPGMTLDEDSRVVTIEPGSPVSDNPAVYPDDGNAACTRSATLTVCAPAAYGRLDDRLAGILAPAAARAARLPSAPTRIRVVPAAGQSTVCNGKELLINEQTARSVVLTPDNVPSEFARCVLGDFDGDSAAEAVMVWILGPSAVRVGAPADPVFEAAAAMGRLPQAEVETALLRDWKRIQDGSLKLSELPGQRP